MATQASVERNYPFGRFVVLSNKWFVALSRPAACRVAGMGLLGGHDDWQPIIVGRKAIRWARRRDSLFRRPMGRCQLRISISAPSDEECVGRRHSPDWPRGNLL